MCQVRQKFRILSAIIRVSYAVQQCVPTNFHFMGFIHSPEGFKMVSSVPVYIQLTPTSIGFVVLCSPYHDES